MAARQLPITALLATEKLAKTSVFSRSGWRSWVGLTELTSMTDWLC